jgi:plasmid maintenance system killer protein
VEITFGDRALQKACSSEKESDKRWGPQNAKRIRQRLEDLHAFSCLADVPSTPPFRCHPLKGQRIGQLAIELKHPFRLVFEIDHDPIPRLADGGVDRARVTAIRIVSVEDYHGE